MSEEAFEVTSANRRRRLSCGGSARGAGQGARTPGLRREVVGARGRRPGGATPGPSSRAGRDRRLLAAAALAALAQLGPPAVAPAAAPVLPPRARPWARRALGARAGGRGVAGDARLPRVPPAPSTPLTRPVVPKAKEANIAQKFFRWFVCFKGEKMVLERGKREGQEIAGQCGASSDTCALEGQERSRGCLSLPRARGSAVRSPRGVGPGPTGCSGSVSRRRDAPPAPSEASKAVFPATSLEIREFTSKRKEP